MEQWATQQCGAQKLPGVELYSADDGSDGAAADEDEEEVPSDDGAPAADGRARGRTRVAEADER